MGGNGLCPIACPTACADPGIPSRCAMSPYVSVLPGGIVRPISYARRLNDGTPAKSNATDDKSTRPQPSAAAPAGRAGGLGAAKPRAGRGAGVCLEVSGPDPEQATPETPRAFGIDELTEPALVAWAVRTTDIDATIAQAREHGFDPGDAVE